MNDRIYRIRLSRELRENNKGAALLHAAWMLEAAVAKLALSQDEEIHFHRYLTPQKGEPVVLLECREDFLRQLYKVEGLGTAEHETFMTRRANSAPLNTMKAKAPKI